jgi:hypothetical protein
VQLFLSIVLSAFAWYFGPFCEYWWSYIFFCCFDFISSSRRNLILNFHCHTFILLLLRKPHIHTFSHFILRSIRLIPHYGRRPPITASFPARSVRWPRQFHSRLWDPSLYFNVWDYFFWGLLLSSLNTNLVLCFPIGYFCAASVLGDTRLYTLPTTGHVFFVWLLLQ